MSETKPEAPQEEQNPIKERIIAMLHSCYDPEIPVDIYELGLIYNIDIKDDGDVELTMTLTSPACPVAGTLPGEVQMKVCSVEGVNDVKVNLVWDPPWTPDQITEEGKKMLGLD